MKPIISYYGGKQRIVSKVLPYLESINHSVYCEPFAGGATLLFAKSTPNISNRASYKEAINDIDDLLINFYRIAKLQTEDLFQLIDATLYSQSDYQKAVNICKSSNNLSDLEKAWAYYVNVNQSFANSLNNGWGTGIIRKHLASTWHNRKQYLKAKLERLEQVLISCEDAIRFIERWDSPETLFYCDPPYPNTDQGHYNGYSIKDYKLLCQILDNIEGSYILSNYDQEIEPKSVQEKVEIKAMMSAAKNKNLNKERTEILYICDRSKTKNRQLTLFSS